MAQSDHSPKYAHSCVPKSVLITVFSVLARPLCGPPWPLRMLKSDEGFGKFPPRSLERGGCLQPARGMTISCGRAGAGWAGLSSVCLSTSEPYFPRENPLFSCSECLCFNHSRQLVVSFAPTEAGIRSSAPNLSIGVSVNRFAHEPAPGIHFQEMTPLLAV